MHLVDLVIAFGYIGVFVTIFAESGFLLGFFLPGDSLLFAIGIFASHGRFDFWLMLVLAIAAAILGDSFGYYIGKKFGPKVFAREDSLLFRREYVDKTAAFFGKHGKRAVILARFVPIVRTFTPVMAGVGAMKYRTFFAFNVVGGIAWAGGLLSISYFLGRSIPGVERYLSYIIIGIIAVSLIPVVIEFLRKD